MWTIFLWSILIDQCISLISQSASLHRASCVCASPFLTTFLRGCTSNPSSTHWNNKIFPERSERCEGYLDTVREEPFRTRFDLIMFDTIKFALSAAFLGFLLCILGLLQNSLAQTDQHSEGPSFRCPEPKCTQELSEYRTLLQSKRLVILAFSDNDLNWLKIEPSAGKAWQQSQ
jgi:hypothetical protein